MTLLERANQFAEAEDSTYDVLVPLDDFAIYYLLASEMARAAAKEMDRGDEASGASTNLLLLVDSRTALQVDAVDGARVAAERAYIFGSVPQPWAGADNLTVCAPLPDGEAQSLFMIVLSPYLSLAIVAEQRGEAFQGVWTSVRPLVVQLANEVMEACGCTDGAELLDREERYEPRDPAVSCTMRLTALLTRQLVLRQRDIAMDKDDLYSVLDILKAISAKRRAHDILYVFVEQVAQAVNMDRCSVVQIWGSDGTGHVLASHEDESVHDLPIDLSKYPEIRRAMETRQKLVINDAHHDPLTRAVAEDLSRAGISSIIVIPVVLFEEKIGSLLLRAARNKAPFSLREISFCEIVASAAANALERAHLFESIQKANEQLQHLAVTDGLTGLYNHRFFRTRLEDEFERARRYNIPLACMILDVDNFKGINDTYGHLQGDSILKQIAELTIQSVRKSDVVARYGGEELVVIMPQTGIEGASIHAERICQAIGEHTYAGMPPDQHVTVSIGVAGFNRESMPDCEALIRVADAALYRAKREGKNRVVLGDS